MSNRDMILHDVSRERDRQEGFVASGKFPATAASRGISDFARLPILVEEVGAVANEINESVIDGDSHNRELYTELVQVAAVAVSWCEALRSADVSVVPSPQEDPGPIIQGHPEEDPHTHETRLHSLEVRAERQGNRVGALEAKVKTLQEAVAVLHPLGLDLEALREDLYSRLGVHRNYIKQHTHGEDGASNLPLFDPWTEDPK